MLRIHRVLGSERDEALHARLHTLAHQGRVEYLALSASDTQRKRLRLVTDKGTECAIALPRATPLFDGAVLALDAERAIIVRLSDIAWLVLEPRDGAAALELGYFAGNFHWRVRFKEGRLLIALDGDPQSYLDRLTPFLASGRAKRVEDDG